MAAYVKKLRLDNQSTHREINRLADHVNGGIVDNIAAEATADGSDPATTMALANALKVKVNAILSEMKEAGIMVAD